MIRNDKLRVPSHYEDNQLDTTSVKLGRGLLKSKVDSKGIFRYPMPTPIKALKYKVSNVYIPESAYLIDSRNDTLVVTKTTKETLTFNHGIYDNMTEFLDEIKRVLDTHTNITMTSVTIQTNNGIETNKIRFELSSGDMTIHCDESTCNEVLGIKDLKATDATNDATSSSSVLVSEMVHRKAGTNYYAVVSKDLRGKKYSDSRNGLLCIVPNLSIGQMCMEMYDGNDYTDLDGLITINSVEIQVLDDLNRGVPFNGHIPSLQIDFIENRT